MAGFITTKHLFTHARIIVCGFGFRCWLHGMWYVLCGKQFTFLELVAKYGE